MKAASYDYNMSGGHADTVATLDDGRTVWINRQYLACDVHHSDECAISKQTACYPQASCTCGAELSDAEKTELMADAIRNGKWGSRPQKKRLPDPDPDGPIKRGAGWCDKCGSYCYGDCTA